MVSVRWLSAAVLAALGAASSGAGTLCDNGRVTVVNAPPAMVGRVCSAADQAFDIFSECGARLPAPVTIRTADGIPGERLGLYHCGKGLIEVLAPKAMGQLIEPAGIFAAIPTTELFDSVIVHELAHALYDATPCTGEPTECLVTSEYLAYGFQLGALPVEYHGAWTPDLDPATPVDPKVMSLGVLMLDTNRFALSAWAHLNQQPDRCAWINGILDGEVVFRRPQY